MKLTKAQLKQAIKEELAGIVERTYPEGSDKAMLDKIGAEIDSLEQKEYYGELTEPEDIERLAQLRKDWKNAVGMSHQSREAGEEFFATGPEPLEKWLGKKLARESKTMKLAKEILRQTIKEEVNEAHSDKEQHKSWMRAWGVTEDIPTTLPEMVAVLDDASSALVGAGDDYSELVRAHKLIVRVASALRIHPAYEGEE